jgi:hypothetical protein
MTPLQLEKLPRKKSKGMFHLGVDLVLILSVVSVTVFFLFHFVKYILEFTKG